MLSEFEEHRKKRLAQDLQALSEEDIEDFLCCPTCGSYDFRIKPNIISCSICNEHVEIFEDE